MATIPKDPDKKWRPCLKCDRKIYTTREKRICANCTDVNNLLYSQLDDYIGKYNPLGAGNYRSKKKGGCK